MTSLEGWSSAIELRPRDGTAAIGSVPGLGALPDRARAEPTGVNRARYFIGGRSWPGPCMLRNRSPRTAIRSRWMLTMGR